MLDLHSHSFFSPDSEEDTLNMVSAAISRGLTHFGISEHIEFYKKNNEFIYDTDFDSYVKYACKLKKQFADKIFMLVGLEIGYDPAVPINRYKAFADDKNIDYIINSIHSINGEDCYYAESFDGYQKHERFTQYLQAVLESVKCDYNYQIVGHLGYISRNAPYSDPVMRYTEYPDIIDEILTEIIKRDKALEINTSVCSCGSEYLPHDQVVKRYVELGGKNITFGSDSHTKTKIGNKYNVVCEGLKSFGVKTLAVFEKKEKKYINI